MTRSRRSPVGPGMTAAVRHRDRSPEPKAPAVCERDVLIGCLQALAAFGIDCQRQNTGAMVNSKGQLVRFGRPGDPDIRGQLPDGRVILIETKRPGERPRPEQWDRIHRCNAGNGVALWVDDPRELARILPWLIAGARVEVEPDGTQYVTDDPREDG